MPFAMADLFEQKRIAGMPIEHYYRPHDSSYLLEVTADFRVMGPPGHMHGGFVASLLDEAMGMCGWWNGHMVLAASLNFKYRNSVPLGRRHLVHGYITRLDRRRLYTEGVLYNEEGRKMASGTGVFIQIDLARFEDLPERMQSFRVYTDYLADGHTVPEAIHYFAGFHSGLSSVV